MPRVQEGDTFGSSCGMGVVRSSCGSQWQCTLGGDRPVPTRASLLAHPVCGTCDHSAVGEEEPIEIILDDAFFVSVHAPCQIVSSEMSLRLADSAQMGIVEGSTFAAAVVLSVQSSDCQNSPSNMQTWESLLHRLNMNLQNQGIAYFSAVDYYSTRCSVVIVEPCAPTVADVAVGCSSFFRLASQIELSSMVPAIVDHVCVLYFNQPPSTPATMARPEFDNLHHQKKRTEASKAIGHRLQISSREQSSVSADHEDPSLTCRRLEFDDSQDFVDLQIKGKLQATSPPNDTEFNRNNPTPKNAPIGARESKTCTSRIEGPRLLGKQAVGVKKSAAAAKPLAPVFKAPRAANKHARRQKEADEAKLLDEMCTSSMDEDDELELDCGIRFSPCMTPHVEAHQVDDDNTMDDSEFTLFSSTPAFSAPAPKPFMTEWEDAKFLKALRNDAACLPLRGQLALVVSSIQALKSSSATSATTYQPSISYRLMCLLELRCRLHIDISLEHSNDDLLCAGAAHDLHLQLCIQTATSAIVTIVADMESATRRYSCHTRGTVESILLQLVRHFMLARQLMEPQTLEASGLPSNEAPTEDTAAGVADRGSVRLIDWINEAVSLSLGEAASSNGVDVSTASLMSRILHVGDTLMELILLARRNPCHVAMCFIGLNKLFATVGVWSNTFLVMLEQSQRAIRQQLQHEHGELFKAESPAEVLLTTSRWEILTFFLLLRRSERTPLLTDSCLTFFCLCERLVTGRELAGLKKTQLFSDRVMEMEKLLHISKDKSA